MASAHERPAAHWFVLAERCHAEEHQGCPSCRRRHCVFRSRWGSRTEYHCTECDFSASRDEVTGESVAVSGQRSAVS